jgi:hypothetical protein
LKITAPALTDAPTADTDRGSSTEVVARAGDETLSIPVYWRISNAIQIDPPILLIPPQLAQGQSRVVRFTSERPFRITSVDSSDPEIHASADSGLESTEHNVQLNIIAGQKQRSSRVREARIKVLTSSPMQPTAFVRVLRLSS